MQINHSTFKALVRKVEALEAKLLKSEVFGNEANHPELQTYARLQSVSRPRPLIFVGALKN